MCSCGKMQNVQGLTSPVAVLRVNAADKIAESPPPAGGEVAKKLHHGAIAAAQPQETECSRMPRVTSSRDQMTLCSNQSEKHFQATIVADKYLLLDQVEGSSLYRCMDVNTQEELVCKVSWSVLVGMHIALNRFHWTMSLTGSVLLTNSYKICHDCIRYVSRKATANNAFTPYMQIRGNKQLQLLAQVCCVSKFYLRLKQWTPKFVFSESLKVKSSELPSPVSPQNHCDTDRSWVSKFERLRGNLPN